MSKIFAINAGSSSLKFKLFEMPQETEITSGLFERIGKEDAIFQIQVNGSKNKQVLPILSHKDAIEVLIKSLFDLKIIQDINEIAGFGHRIVHGGETYKSSVVITTEVADRIDDLSELAPLHNPANLQGYQFFHELFPNSVHVAVFDTAFHSTMDESHYLYPLPYSFYQDLRIRKYGFHGTSHQYISQRVKELLPDSKRVICCHLGNGCSMSAILDGHCVNTTMGFTPLAGLMMGTRTGDIDPSIVTFAMEKTNRSAHEILDVLNKQSGLLGVSGVSSDMRDVEGAANGGDARAELAIDMFAIRVAQKIGSYAIDLGGLDTVVFTAGIGENSATIRNRIIDKIKGVFPVVVDQEKNGVRGEDIVISTPESSIRIAVIPTNEEIMLVRETMQFLPK